MRPRHRCADANQDGILDADEVIAYQERVFNKHEEGGNRGVVIGQRRSQGWSDAAFNLAALRAAEPDAEEV